MFVYHISLDAWTIYTTATAVKFMARMPTTYPVDTLYFGSTDGRTYQFLTGTADNASAISAELISKEILLSFPTRTNIQWVDIFSSQRSSTNVFYDTDRADKFSPLGALKERVSSFPVKTQECNSVRIRTTENSGVVSMIEGFNIEHEPLKKRVN